MTRSLARAVKVVACAALFMLALFTTLPCCGATWNITNTLSSGPGSLREALAKAASGDVINITATGTIPLGSTLDVKTSVTINGTGASRLVISGSHIVPVFFIADGIRVLISGVTIRDGLGGAGGGIYNNGATLTVSETTVTANAASDGGAIYNINGSVSVSHSTLSGNSSVIGGGGVYSEGGRLFVANSTLSGNRSQYGAGGIETTKGGELSVTNSTLSGNSGLRAGGIFNREGTLSVTNSTLAGNSGTIGFGAGGIRNDGTAILKNSILANNPGGNYYGPGTNSSQGHNLSDDGTCSAFFTHVGDRNHTPAGLDPGGLKNNGGPAQTETIALLPTSPAVNAIPLSPIDYCTAIGGSTPIYTDQRSIRRPQGSACDIGAFELVGAPTSVPFSAFSAKLLISLPSFFVRPGFDLDANFTLGGRSDGIHLLSEPVTLQVGTYNVTIPPGSFRPDSLGSGFSGEIGGVALTVYVQPMGADAYFVKATGSPVNVAAPFGNPMPVGITIGNDSGTVAVIPIYF